MRASLETLRGKKNLVGCEIGVSFGENAHCILQNLDVVRIYLVDPLWLSESGLRKANETLEDYLDKIVWIGKKSEHVTNKEIPVNSLDFCYIDGNHTYEAVEKDLRMYWPRVKKGGLFAGHDYGDQNGVKLAVDEFLEGKEFFVDKTCHDWWIYK